MDACSEHEYSTSVSGDRRYDGPGPTWLNWLGGEQAPVFPSVLAKLNKSLLQGLNFVYNIISP